MPQTWSEANMILIHKAEKDPLNSASYRHIALLNTGAQIFTRTLASRLRPIITNYVHVVQTGFMPNRQLADNIRRTLDIISHCKQQQIEVIVASIDMEKAFNSVSISKRGTLQNGLWKHFHAGNKCSLLKNHSTP